MLVQQACVQNTPLELFELTIETEKCQEYGYRTKYDVDKKISVISLANNDFLIITLSQQ